MRARAERVIMIQTTIMQKKVGINPAFAAATGRASMPPPMHVPATRRDAVNVRGAKEDMNT
jgi:hypothetical protein